jgi:hypothetical protein
MTALDSSRHYSHHLSRLGRNHFATNQPIGWWLDAYRSAMTSIESTRLALLEFDSVKWKFPHSR